MKKLKELLKGIDVTETIGNLDVGISGIEYDSRKVGEGSVFVAIKGFNQDGTKFIGDALKNGAAAVVLEGKKLKCSGTLIIVRDARKALASLSVNFFGDPSGYLKITGITGTNGKTTTSYIIDSILRESSKKSGLIGTINYRFGNRVEDALYTTPESPDLQRLFRNMVDSGIEYCVMEVSSHSLILDRVHKTNFDVGVFTNLTQDHFDFHKNEREYFKSKLKLFTEYDLKKAVVNIDDSYGRLICKQSSAQTITVGIKEKGDIFAKNIEISIGGVKFIASVLGRELDIFSKLVGTHNVYNILCAIGAGIALDLPLSKIKEGIKALEYVPGRFEKINMGQNFTVIVDYAHTDDALKNVINASNALTDKNVIVVFGCGGDRDKDKRAKMGMVAGNYADYTVITSDNPRSEDPSSIIYDAEAGIKKTSGKYCLITDRGQAIEYAIKIAQEGDIVIIAGKGHEKYQIFGNKRIYFDDCEEVRKFIKMKPADF